MGNTYKCVTCGSVKKEGDVYYQVKTISTDGSLIFKAACSLPCAEKERFINSEIHKNRYENVITCSIQKKEW